VARKMAVAGEHHRVITPDNLAQFGRKLKRRTLRLWRSGMYAKSSWKKLAFDDIGHYQGIPPQHAREALAKAKELKVFSRFEVGTLKEEVTSQYRDPDPILVGVIDGCDNKYFIAQWDNDVAIEDILKRGEG